MCYLFSADLRKDWARQKKTIAQLVQEEGEDQQASDEQATSKHAEQSEFCVLSSLSEGLAPSEVRGVWVRPAFLCLSIPVLATSGSGAFFLRDTYLR